MADYVTNKKVTGIRTSEGIAFIDYDSLVNKPKLEGYSKVDHTHTPEDIEGLDLKVNETVDVAHGGTGVESIADNMFILGSGTNQVKLLTPDDVKTALGIGFISYDPGNNTVTITPYVTGSVIFTGTVNFQGATVIGLDGVGTGGEGVLMPAVYS